MDNRINISGAVSVEFLPPASDAPTHARFSCREVEELNLGELSFRETCAELVKAIVSREEILSDLAELGWHAAALTLALEEARQGHNDNGSGLSRKIPPLTGPKLKDAFADAVRITAEDTDNG